MVSPKQSSPAKPKSPAAEEAIHAVPLATIPPSPATTETDNTPIDDLAKEIDETTSEKDLETLATAAQEEEGKAAVDSPPKKKQKKAAGKGKKKVSPTPTAGSTSDEKEREESTAAGKATVEEEEEEVIPKSPAPKSRTRASTRKRKAVDTSAREIAAPKTVCFKSLKLMRVEKEVRGYFKAIGWEPFLEWSGQISEEVVREFFGSLRIKETKDEGVIGIQFELFDRAASIGGNELDLCLDMAGIEDLKSKAYQEALKALPEYTKMELQKIWTKLGKGGEFIGQSTKSIQLKSHALRICHRILAINFFGKTDTSSAVSHLELGILWCMHQKIRLHFSACLCAQMKWLQTHPLQRLSLVHFSMVYASRMNLIKKGKELEMMVEGKFDIQCFKRMQDIVPLSDGSVKFLEEKPVKVEARDSVAEAKAKEEIAERQGAIEAQLEKIEKVFEEVKAMMIAYFDYSGFRFNIRRFNRNQLTKIELLQIAVKRDNERLRKIVGEKTGSIAESWSMHCVTISSHIQQSSAGFIMNLSIGTPAQPPFSALIDTGSDLIWTKCKKASFNQSTPVFDPERSSSYSELKCNSDRCKSLLSNDSSCGKLGECAYKYGYGDNTSTQGVLATETFTFEGNHPVSNLDFGCGLDNKGPHIEELAGIVGLGRGNMSLVSQMKEPRFSYCLPEFDSGETGVLSVGGGYVNTAPRGGKTTPLINNPFNPTFYYLSLQGITIGNTRLRINKINFEIKPNGTGGLIIDSGTTLTFLEKCAFNQVKKELTRQIKLPSFDGRTAVGFELCYNLTRPAETINFPNITFHFLGQGADFEVIPANYFVLADENETTGCLVMGSSSSDEMSIFGNFQQQNALVVYDLAQNKLSYLPNTKCSTAT